MVEILLVVGMLLVGRWALKLRAVIDGSTLEQWRKNRLHSVVLSLMVVLMGIFSFILIY